MPTTYKDKIYSSSPVFLQNAMISMYGLKLYYERYRGSHNRLLREILLSQYYNKIKLKDLVNDLFIRLVRETLVHVPYIQNLHKQGMINLNSIKNIDDITKFPILEKETVRSDPDFFVAQNIKSRSLKIISTSGTTGTTLKIFVDNESRRRNYAFFVRSKIWAGVKDRDLSITFAGRTIVPHEQTKPPFWRYNMMMNNYLFSSYHLSEKNYYSYVQKITKIRPMLIDSYPSAIYVLAQFMKNNNISGIYPKAIITSSETLYEYQRNEIEDVFKCKIFDQYGAAEQVSFINQCEFGTYHVNPEYGYVEVIRSDGKHALPGEEGRLICTSFTNKAMPLVRYDIGDIVVLSEKTSCQCGRCFDIIERIHGRNDDLIKLKDGRIIGRLDPIFKGLISIKEAQIIQTDYDHILIKIVPSRIYNKERDEQFLKNELTKRTGKFIRITFEYTQCIPKTNAGKFRSVISQV